MGTELSETQRPKMRAFDVRVDPSKPAESIQSAIKQTEELGFHVTSYLPIGVYAGVLLAHDHGDQKPNAPDPAPIVEAPSPDPSDMTPPTEQITTRDEPARQNQRKGKRR